MKLLNRPRPSKYQSLASYIRKVSDANHCESLSWMKSLWGISKGSITLEKMNCDIADITIKAIKEYIDITDEELRTISIDQFGVGLWISSNKNGVQVDRSNFVNEKHTKFCPKCLEEQSYHKIYWQLKDILVCLDHNTILIEKCENCDSKIVVEDVINGFCSKCGFNLKACLQLKCNDNQIIRNQIRLYMAYGIEHKHVYDEIEKVFITTVTI